MYQPKAESLEISGPSFFGIVVGPSAPLGATRVGFHFGATLS
jgi:hypothetical protein